MRRSITTLQAPCRRFISTTSRTPNPTSTSTSTPTTTSTSTSTLHPTRSQSTAAAATLPSRPHLDVSQHPPIISHITPPPQSKKTIKPSISTMSDTEIISAVESGTLKFFNLENDLGDYARAVRVRRIIVEKATSRTISSLPHENYNYAAVAGQCCENVIGVVPIPVGVAGPLLVDGKEYYVPMATVEGALVASTTRGCKAISMCGGAHTEIVNDGMSRAPVLGAPSVKVASQVKQYIESHFNEIATAFNSTSRFARLKDIKIIMAGRKLYVRFRCTTGDAMGMNMVGKGVDHALSIITNQFPSVSVLSLSGNVCTDKKPSAINFIEGRGKSVVVDAVITKSVVEKLLKTTVDALVDLNYSKNLLGSAMAGSIGGLNAHASNVVTAMFLATGQDCAQNVESSNCITLMEKEGEDLHISVTMPSLEVGTVGGGTTLPGQAAMLDLLGVRGSHPTAPGTNSAQLARIIASTVMAGELSLMSALSSGHLISSHMKLNRKAHPEPSKTA